MSRYTIQARDGSGTVLVEREVEAGGRARRQAQGAQAGESVGRGDGTRLRSAAAGTDSGAGGRAGASMDREVASLSLLDCAARP